MTNNNENKILYKNLSYKIQGLIFDIRNDLGSGHKESIYQKALEKELTRVRIKFVKEPSIKIYSKKGEFLGLYRPDFLIENKIIVELKAVEYISKQETARVYDYLRNSEYELAYLVNFASPKLYIKRLIFTNDRKYNQRMATNQKTNGNRSTEIRRHSFSIRSYSWIILFVAISLIFVAISGLPASAAELILESPIKEFGVNQQFEVDLMLDPEAEDINAVSGKIVFSNDFLELKSINEGDSIINLWVLRPKISDSGVSFSGIISGGFKGVLSPYYQGGKPGKIISLFFSAKTAGQGIIEIKDAEVLLNDGKATKAPLKVSNFSFAVREIYEQTQIETKKPELDKKPPAEFELKIIKDQNLFNGKYALIWLAEDKGSGIAAYAIHESRRMEKRIATNKWIEAESPYLLKDQKLRSYIYVKAADRAGNERIAMLPPPNPMKWYENYIVLGIILLTIIAGYIIRKILWKKNYTKIH